MCRSGDVANINRVDKWYYARHVAGITCVDEWYHPIYGTPNVAAMIHRHDNVSNRTRADKTEPPRHVIPTE